MTKLTILIPRGSFKVCLFNKLCQSILNRTWVFRFCPSLNVHPGHIYIFVKAPTIYTSHTAPTISLCCNVHNNVIGVVFVPLFGFYSISITIFGTCFRPLQVSTIQAQCQVNAGPQSAALANIHLAVHFAGYMCSVTTMRHVHTIHWRNVSSMSCQCRRQVHDRSSDRNTQHQTILV